MIIEDAIEIMKSVGFPITIALILLWDKIKSNGALKQVVQNNNQLLRAIYEHMIKLKGG